MLNFPNDLGLKKVRPAVKHKMSQETLRVTGQMGKRKMILLTGQVSSVNRKGKVR